MTSVHVLGVDTSTPAGGIAVVEAGRVLASYHRQSSHSYSRHLLATVDHVLKDLGLEVEQLAGVAVAVGPGSFTGLRVGLAMVQGLCWAADRPVMPVSTLEAHARRMRHVDGTLVPSYDARQGRVYTARFRARAGQIERLCEDRNLAASEAFAIDDDAAGDAGDAEDAVFFGEGARRYRAEIERVARGGARIIADEDSFVAEQVALMGAEALQRGEALDSRRVGIRYVKPASEQAVGG